MARVKLIIPAYNSEKFIEASVRSALGQSFRDLEITVIDDGSRDSTPRLLEALRQEDARLNYITVPNGGPAMARNRALDALGDECEFVMFMDADDILLPDTVEYAVNGTGEADMGIFGFSIMNTDGSHRDYYEPDGTVTPDTMREDLARLYKANLLNQVWGKIFRADIIRDNRLRFPDYRWGEDRLFIYDCLEHVRSVRVLSGCKYRYIMHEGESLITKFYDKKFQVCLEADERMMALCRRFGVTEEGSFRYMFAKSVFSCITTLFAPSCRLTPGEKRAYVADIIRNDHVKQRCRGVFGGMAVKGLCAVIRTGSVGLTMLAFRFVAFTGTKLPGLFTRLKHRK